MKINYNIIPYFFSCKYFLKRQEEKKKKKKIDKEQEKEKCARANK